MFFTLPADSDTHISGTDLLTVSSLSFQPAKRMKIIVFLCLLSTEIASSIESYQRIPVSTD